MLDDITRMLNETPDGRHIYRQEAHLHALRSYWESMRRSHIVPRRADIDPRRIEALLPNAFIAERIAPGITRLRVAGSHLSDLMGMEVRGMPLGSFIAPEARSDFALRLVDLFEAPAALRMVLRSRGSLGRPELTGTLVLLPLRSDLGDVSRALGCLVTTGQIGRPARRFEIVAARMEPLRPVQSVPFRTLSDATAAPPPPASRSRAHLRVVK
jgi:hypothetical protein